MLNIEMVVLSSIRVDGGTQMRVALPEHRVDEYAEALADGAEFPPVVVFDDGDNYWMGDGFTRYFAHKKAGLKTIKAEVRKGTRKDAFKHALGANATHGEPRTNADKRKAVNMAFLDEELRNQTDPAIAEICQVSRSLVQTVRHERAGRDPFPSRAKEEPQKSAERTRPEPEPAPDQEAEVEPEAETEAEPEKVYDCLGVEITDLEKIAAFSILARCKEAARLHREAMAIVGALCEKPGGEQLALEVGGKVKGGKLSYRDADAKRAADRLENYTPYLSVCPYCHVGRPADSHAGRKCGACRDRGWITKAQWKQCDAKLQARILADFNLDQPEAA